MLLALACADAPPEQLPRDDAAVYAAVLRDHLALLDEWDPADLPPRDELLVVDHTRAGSALHTEAQAVAHDPDAAPDWFHTVFLGLRDACLQDYARRAPDETPLPAFGVQAPIQRMDAAEYQALHEADGDFWEAFEQRYPRAHGLYVFSDVGYDATGRQALVSLHWSEGFLNGWSMLYQLERSEEGRWHVAIRCTYLVS